MCGTVMQVFQAFGHLRAPRGAAIWIPLELIAFMHSRSPSGETWAGRGARPRWMVAALKKGKKMERFLIKKR